MSNSRRWREFMQWWEDFKGGIPSEIRKSIDAKIDEIRQRTEGK